VQALRKQTILVVDDDKLVQKSFQLLFERHEYHVLVAGDGNEALAILEDHAVELMLLDVLMPDREGLETLLEIKRRRPRLPVIVISGAGTQSKLDFLATAQKFGADEVLRKPIASGEILKVVANHIARAA
jgi:CheY-like chemotaxis protein